MLKCEPQKIGENRDSLFNKCIHICDEIHVSIMPFIDMYFSPPFTMKHLRLYRFV